MNQARCLRSACSSFAATAVAIVLVATTGCSSPDPNKLMNGGQPAPAGAVPTPDFTSALASLKGLQYQNEPSTYTRVSNIFLNQKDETSNVAVWISTPAKDDYLKIKPEDHPDTKPGPGVFLPVGTTIIRAVYDKANMTDLTAVTKYTLMVKGPPGYLTGFGDWAFGVTDKDGVPATDMMSGQQELGLVSASCHLGCHENQRGSTNDWLFGVECIARLDNPTCPLPDGGTN